MIFIESLFSSCRVCLLLVRGLIGLKELLFHDIVTVFKSLARIKTCFAEQFWRIFYRYPTVFRFPLENVNFRFTFSDISCSFSGSHHFSNSLQFSLFLSLDGWKTHHVFLEILASFFYIFFLWNHSVLYNSLLTPLSVSRKL